MRHRKNGRAVETAAVKAGFSRATEFGQVLVSSVLRGRPFRRMESTSLIISKTMLLKRK